MYNTVGMVSLGCAKNQVDAEVMLGLFQQEGYTIVNNSSSADVIIVNTCGFIGPAKEESINAILEQTQHKTTGNCKALIVTGCLGERYSEELMVEIPEIDAVVGTGNYPRIISIMEQVAQGIRKAYYGELDIRLENLPRMISTQKPTAYLKIAEGCDNCCSYCIIPKLRGRYRSREFNSLIEEAEQLVDSGIQELIIIAQDTTRYGQGADDNNDLADLLKALCKIEGLRWIRLMYCYPDRISEKLIEAIQMENKICCYLDIPIQHIHPRILKEMNRTFSPDDIRALLGRIRTAIPKVVIRTSLIVGFPGEDDDAFDTLLRFVKEGHFNHIGVFTYSLEEGTVAAQMSNQVDDSVKEERRVLLLTEQKNQSKRFNKKRIGEICEVLIKGQQSPGLYFGRSYGESPDIDGLIYVTSTEPLKPGDFITVQILKAYEYDLLGENYESGK